LLAFTTFLFWGNSVMPNLQENPTLPSSECILPEDSLVTRIRQHLEEKTCFRGRTGVLTIEISGETIVLSGRLPSFYLKQTLQESIRKVPGVRYIDNRTHVT